MRRTGLYVLLSLSLLLMALGISVIGVGAQDNGNLLKDPGFDGTYTGRGRGDFNIPSDWGVWTTSQPHTADWMNMPPVAYPHNGPDPNPHSRPHALNMNKGYATFTAAVYQQVTVPQGANVTGSIWAYLHTCNPAPNATKCGSAVESGAYVKVGIDTNGGTDPTVGSVVWSDQSRPHDQWKQVSVSATASGTTVTLFAFVTQEWPAQLNNVYFDDASLTIGGAGGSANPAVPPTATPPPEVAFVVPQGAQPDGSIVHTVDSGDTIDSIAVAYGVSRATIMALNNITNPSLIVPGQRLLIKPAPSGSASSTQEAGVSIPNSADAAATAMTNGGGPPVNDGGQAPPPNATEDTSGQNTAGQDTANPNSGQDIAQAPTVTLPPATAPVQSVASGQVQPAINPLAQTSSVCVTLFDDTNQNRLQESGEALLANGDITLMNNGASVGEYKSDGVSDPHCFDNLNPGDYVAVASAPSGYGLTTPNQYRVQVVAGTNINVVFGAAQGVVPPNPPAADAGGVTTQTQTVFKDNSSPILRNLGLIVFGLAGVVFVAGAGLALLMRRR